MSTKLKQDGNLVQNPNFDKVLAPWSINDPRIQPGNYLGRTAARFSKGIANGTTSQIIRNVLPGRYSFRYSAASEGELTTNRTLMTVVYGYDDGGGSGSYDVRIPVVTNEWLQSDTAEFNFERPGSMEVRLRTEGLGDPDDSESIFFTDIVVTGIA